MAQSKILIYFIVLFYLFNITTSAPFQQLASNNLCESSLSEMLINMCLFSTVPEHENLLKLFNRNIDHSKCCSVSCTIEKLMNICNQVDDELMSISLGEQK